MAKFDIKQEISGNDATLILSGTFDGSSAWELINAINELADMAKITIDFSNVTGEQNGIEFGYRVLLNNSQTVKRARNGKKGPLIIYKGRE